LDGAGVGAALNASLTGVGNDAADGLARLAVAPEALAADVFLAALGADLTRLAKQVGECHPSEGAQEVTSVTGLQNAYERVEAVAGRSETPSDMMRAGRRRRPPARSLR
jgi:hypothetical protein